ncbi:MAG: glycosyltransferase family 2 protein [Actinobacteria bacterium]|nr:glycosyltransferase family 2 protein [Actinomycetota bacterium]
MKKKEKVAIVMPAFNAERTLEKVYKGLRSFGADFVLLVDDGSKDQTVKLAKKLKIKTIVHPKNMGYGVNQKTMYGNILKTDADFVVMLHPDGQYDPKDLPLFINALKNKRGDLILGSRFLAGGDKETPFYKAISIKMITMFFNLILGIKLTEVNTGYRGYTRKLLETIPYQKNGSGYIFDPQLIIQSVYFGFKVAEVPVAKAYNPEAISPNLSKSIHHGLENIYLLLQFVLHKLNFQRVDFLIR